MTEHVLACSSLLDFVNLICNMTTLRKCFDPLIPPLWVQGMCMGKIFATILLHASFTFDMQHDHHSVKVEFRPLSDTLSPPKGSNPGLRTKSLFDIVHIYCTSVCM